MEGPHQTCSLRLNLTQHGKTHQVELFLDYVGGGVWPFLVGGVICLLNCNNKQDLNLLNSQACPSGLPAS